MSAEKIEKDVRIEQLLKSKWIGYSTADKILERLEDLMVHPQVHRMPGLLIFGETNNGKTTIINEFVRRHPVIKDEQSGDVELPLVRIEMPPDANQDSIYISLLRELYVPFQLNSKKEQKANQVFMVMRRLGVRMLIIDELHNLLDANRLKQNQVINTIKYLSNTLQIPIVGVGTKEAKNVFRSDGQLSNRFKPVEPDLSYCSFCWESLLVDTQSVAEEDVAFIRSIEDGIKNGWYEYNDFSMYTPLFLQGFWRIVYSFYGTKGRSKEVWKKLCVHFDKPFFELSNLRLYNAFKDEIPVNRLAIISLIRHMLVNWPDEMIAACESAGVTKTVLDLPNSGLPFWMQKIAETNLNKNWYKISLEEFDSALDCLHYYNIPITKSSVAKLLGLDISRKLNKEEARIFTVYSSIKPITVAN